MSTLRELESTDLKKRNRPLGSFPSLFHDIMERLSKKPQLILELEYPDGQAAQAHRFRWYDFKKAAHAQRPEWRRVLEGITVKLDGAKLIWAFRDELPLMKSLEEQMNRQLVEQGMEPISREDSYKDLAPDFNNRTLGNDEDASDAAYAKWFPKDDKAQGAQEAQEAQGDSAAELSPEEAMKKEFGL